MNAVKTNEHRCCKAARPHNYCTTLFAIFIVQKCGFSKVVILIKNFSAFQPVNFIFQLVHQLIPRLIALPKRQNGLFRFIQRFDLAVDVSLVHAVSTPFRIVGSNCFCCPLQGRNMGTLCVLPIWASPFLLWTCLAQSIYPLFVWFSGSP